MIPLDVKTKRKRGLRLWQSYAGQSIRQRALIKEAINRTCKKSLIQFSNRIDTLVSLKFAFEGGVFLHPRVLQRRGWLEWLENTFRRTMLRKNDCIGSCGRRLYQYTTAFRRLKQFLSISYTDRKTRYRNMNIARSSLRKFCKRIKNLKWSTYCRKRANVLVARKVFSSLSHWVFMKSTCRVNKWISECKWKNYWLSRWHDAVKWEVMQKYALKVAIENYYKIRTGTFLKKWIEHVGKAHLSRQLTVQQIGNRYLCQWVSWIGPIQAQRVSNKFAQRFYSFKHFRRTIQKFRANAIEKIKLRTSFLVFRQMFPKISQKYKQIDAFSNYLSSFPRHCNTTNPTEITIYLTSGFQAILQVYLWQVCRWDRFNDCISLKLSRAMRNTLTCNLITSALNGTRLSIEDEWSTTRQKFHIYSSFYCMVKCFRRWRIGLGCFGGGVNTTKQDTAIELSYTGIMDPSEHDSLLDKFFRVKKAVCMHKLRIMMFLWRSLLEDRNESRMYQLLYTVLKNQLRWGFYTLKNKINEIVEAEKLRPAHIVALRQHSVGIRRSADIAGHVVRGSPMAWGRSNSADWDSVRNRKEDVRRTTYERLGRCSSLDRIESPFVIHQNENLTSDIPGTDRAPHRIDVFVGSTPYAQNTSHMPRDSQNAIAGPSASQSRYFVSRTPSRLRSCDFSSADSISPISRPPALPCDLSPSLFDVDVSHQGHINTFEFTNNANATDFMSPAGRENTARQIPNTVENTDKKTSDSVRHSTPRTVDHPSLINSMKRGYHSEYLNRQKGHSSVLVQRRLLN